MWLLLSRVLPLAIKFMPTLAKVEERDTSGLARLKQLFYDWRIWHGVFERTNLTSEIVPEIGDKLPTDRTARVNELNNMFDRRVISRKYYRQEMEKLGYSFPDSIDVDIEADLALDQKYKAAVAGETEEDSDGENNSNNASRPNESAGTEAEQSVEQQTRAGTA